MCAPAPAAVKTGRRAPEGAPALAEARGGPAAGGVGRGAAVGAAGAAARVRLVRVVQVQHVAVVAGALLGRREGRVGFADAHEALRGGGVAAIVVGVVGLGEGVEGAFGGRVLVDWSIRVEEEHLVKGIPIG